MQNTRSSFIVPEAAQLQNNSSSQLNGPVAFTKHFYIRGSIWPQEPALEVGTADYYIYFMDEEAEAPRYSVIFRRTCG